MLVSLVCLCQREDDGKSNEYICVMVGNCLNARSKGASNSKERKDLSLSLQEHMNLPTSGLQQVTVRLYFWPTER